MREPDSLAASGDADRRAFTHILLAGDHDLLVASRPPRISTSLPINAPTSTRRA